MMKIALVAAAIITLAACSGGSQGESGESLYTLDLATYWPGENPSALRVSNETLVFPLGVGPTAQTLSGAAPGSLMAVYTRVGCTVDPNEWIGPGGTVPVQLPTTAPVRLVEVTVDQVGDPGRPASLDQLADATCVTFRSADEVWRPLARSSNVTVTGQSVRTEFALDAGNATAAAIFLPTYTYVSKVSYRLVHETSSFD